MVHMNLLISRPPLVSGFLSSFFHSLTPPPSLSFISAIFGFCLSPSFPRPLPPAKQATLWESSSSVCPTTQRLPCDRLKRKKGDCGDKKNLSPLWGGAGEGRERGGGGGGDQQVAAASTDSAVAAKSHRVARASGLFILLWICTPGLRSSPSLKEPAPPPPGAAVGLLGGVIETGTEAAAQAA